MANVLEVATMPELNVPNGDVIVAFHHTITGFSRDLVCTIGAGVDEAEPLDTTSANDMFGWWANEMKTSVASQLTFVSCVLYWKQPLGYVPIPSTATPVVGTGSGSSAIPGTAIMVEKNTNRPGRSGKGRMFLPGVGEALIDPNGNLTSAYITQINGDLQSFYDAVTTSGQFDDLLLFHQVDNISPTPTVITSLTVDPRASTISKRFRRS